MAAHLTPAQVGALADETDAVVRLLRSGIDAVGALGPVDTFVHLPLQLLAQGTERLLKLTLALAWLQRDGALPPVGELKKRRHDIVGLTDELIDVVSQQPDYASRPAIQDDIAFVKGDQDLRRMLRLLTTFGTWSRYYRLEQFLDPSAVSERDDPDLAWERMKMDFLAGQPERLDLLLPEWGDEFYRRFGEHATTLLNRFGRAIARMWTLGAVHPEAARYSGIISEFLIFDDRGSGTAPPP